MSAQWLVSWPENGCPKYRGFDTEQEAEAAADGMRKSGWAKEAVVFEVQVDEGDAA